jgi:hypothetical protein
MRLAYFLFAALQFISNAAFGQSKVVFADICESNGNDAMAGTNFKNGYNLAIEEINANSRPDVSLVRPAGAIASRTGRA